MCCKNRGPRCPTCHKPAPRHRCRCPAKYASNPTSDTQYDSPPSYEAAAFNPRPPTNTSLPVSVQARCGGRGYGGCGSSRRQHHGPIQLLVSLIIRKVQEKQERERLAAIPSNEREPEVQERGVVETVDEKPMKVKEVDSEKRDEDVEVLIKSVRGMSF